MLSYNKGVAKFMTRQVQSKNIVHLHMITWLAHNFRNILKSDKSMNLVNNPSHIVFKCDHITVSVWYRRLLFNFFLKVLLISLSLFSSKLTIMVWM